MVSSFCLKQHINEIRINEHVQRRTCRSDTVNINSQVTLESMIEPRVKFNWHKIAEMPQTSFKRPRPKSDSNFKSSFSNYFYTKSYKGYIH